MRKPLQLSFTTQPMFKAMEHVRVCALCGSSYMLGFACWRCGIEEHWRGVKRSRGARRCMTPGCDSFSGGHPYCGEAHRRAQALTLRDHWLCALHVARNNTPHGTFPTYERHIKALDPMVEGLWS